VSEVSDLVATITNEVQAIAQKFKDEIATLEQKLVAANAASSASVVVGQQDLDALKGLAARLEDPTLGIELPEDVPVEEPSTPPSETETSEPQPEGESTEPANTETGEPQQEEVASEQSNS
jgi:hypothetical protein